MNSIESFVSRWAVGSSAMMTEGLFHQSPDNGHALGFNHLRPFGFGVCFRSNVEEIKEMQPSFLMEEKFSPEGRRQHGVFQSRDASDEIELLEDETEGLPPDLREESLRKARDLPVENPDPTAGGPCHASYEAQEGCLPRPARALEHGGFVGFKDRLIPWTATNSFGFPELKTFLTSLNSIMVRLFTSSRNRVHNGRSPGGDDRGHCVRNDR